MILTETMWKRMNSRGLSLKYYSKHDNMPQPTNLYQIHFWMLHIKREKSVNKHLIYLEKSFNKYLAEIENLKIES